MVNFAVVLSANIRNIKSSSRAMILAGHHIKGMAMGRVQQWRFHVKMTISTLQPTCLAIFCIGLDSEHILYPLAHQKRNAGMAYQTCHFGGYLPYF